MIEFSKPTIKPTSLRAAIKALTTGDEMVVRMDEYERTSVAHAASIAGREIGGKFSVHCDWDGSRYIIKRTA